MTLYKGNAKIRDTGSYGVYKGSQPIAAIYKGSQKVYLFNRSLTFNASGSFQTYTVPSYVSKVHVDCVASRGHAGSNTAGKGGRVQCDLNVTPNQTLYIMVGAIPSSAGTASYNASDIRTNNAGVTNTTSLNSRLIVAGGGGSGSTATYNAAGGNGGGTTGAKGANWDNTAQGGYGGTQSAGGARGESTQYFPTYGNAGTLGLGGTGGYGGTGGAGLYGGGGGSGGQYGNTMCGGGGGGSSYANASLCSNVSHTQGYRNGAGYITITEIG